MAFSTSFFTLDQVIPIDKDQGQPLRPNPPGEGLANEMDNSEPQHFGVSDPDPLKLDVADGGAGDDATMTDNTNQPRIKTEDTRMEDSSIQDETANGRSGGGVVNEAPLNGAPAEGSTKKPPPKKKKGMATTIKAPKRNRVSGTVKKTGGTKAGAKKKTASSQAGEDGDENGGEAAEGGSSESDSGPYCLCRGPDNHRFMIACDRCEDWFHGECIDMDKWTGENLVQKYICPNCSDGDRYVTRYKKMCSYEGCTRPARIYEPTDRSVFCSEEHCQAWWEQLIATLPKTKSAGFDTLTQQEFMGLLDTPSGSGSPRAAETSWKLGDKPFGVPPDFWEKRPPSSSPLTAEEDRILSASAATRLALGEEIILCQKMLQLIDMALKRREQAIAAGKGSAKDFCGYDMRLDEVGVKAPFQAFLQTPEGEAAFKAGKLDTPLQMAEGEDPLTAGMCTKKKCKPHVGWSAILTKNVKHSIKELTSQAQKMLNRERMIRESAAERSQMQRRENNTVEVIDWDTDMEDV
ncbi:hypothetical protein OQA88_6325 [Cercophora sp. LCS_1]